MLNQLDNYRYQLDEAMVLHFMGYGDTSAVSEPVLEQVREQMQTIHQFSDQWGSTVEVPIASVSKHEVVLTKASDRDDNGLITLRSKQLPRVLGRCDYVVVLLVTAGTRISERSKISQHQDPLTAFILDALGSAMVVELIKSLTHHVFKDAQQRQYGTTLRLGPGYTGWHISDQAVLSSCFNEQSIPVMFERGAMMKPQKTLLGLLGLKPGGKQAPEIEPCRVCDLPDCRLRKFEFRSILKA
jgi:hypothetical protein